MTQIKIEVPANDTIALSALGEALTRIAAERGYDTQETIEETFKEAKSTLSTINSLIVGSNQCTVVNQDNVTDDVEQVIDETHEKFIKANVELPEVRKDGIEEDSNVGSGLDKDGLAWDKRIHSRGKTRLADDTWRLARKPNDKSDDEWSTYVEEVKAELKAVQSIAPPSVEDDGLPALEIEDITQAEINAGNLPPVPTQETKGFDEAVSPPVADTETVTPPKTPTVDTFPELMKWITSEGKKRGVTNDLIKATLVEIDPVLTGLPLIATRADLIPTLVAKLEAKL